MPGVLRVLWVATRMCLELQLVITTSLFTNFAILSCSIGWNLFATPRLPSRCLCTWVLQAIQVIIAALFLVVALRLFPVWLMLLLVTWVTRLLPAALLMYGLLVSLLYRLLQHVFAAPACCFMNFVANLLLKIVGWLSCSTCTLLARGSGRGKDAVVCNLLIQLSIGLC